MATWGKILYNKLSVVISNFVHGTLQSKFFSFRFEFLTFDIFSLLSTSNSPILQAIQERRSSQSFPFTTGRDSEGELTNSASRTTAKVAMVAKEEWWIDESKLKVNYSEIIHILLSKIHIYGTQKMCSHF
jgi:hypothetical protein